jgi:hypothetical protein
MKADFGLLQFSSVRRVSSDMNSDLEHEWRHNSAVLIPTDLDSTGMPVMEQFGSALWRDKPGAGMTLKGSVSTAANGSGSGCYMGVSAIMSHACVWAFMCDAHVVRAFRSSGRGPDLNHQAGFSVSPHKIRISS